MLNGIIPASWSGHLHAALRIVTGLLFLEHGTSKYFNFPATEYFANGVEVFSLMGLAGALEIIGGLLIIIGLFTRITAFVLAGFMAVAYFMAHAPNSFFPLSKSGRCGHPLLLHFPVFLRRRRRPLEPGRKPEIILPAKQKRPDNFRPFLFPHFP